MPESIGTPYSTQIPRFDENADIQTALRLYHYGSDTNSPGTLDENSIAGYLDSLENNKVGVNPSILSDLDDLNDINVSGYYVQVSGSNAVGNNYPIDVPGILKVVSYGNLIAQEYHAIGVVSNVINKPYWRVKISTSWSDWEVNVTEEEVSQLISDYAYAKGSVFTKSESNANFSPRLFLESVKTEDYTLVAEDTNTIIAMNVIGTSNIFIDANSEAPFSVGSVVNIYNMSEDLVTVSPVENSGVVIRNAGTLEQYREASLRYRGNDEWVAAGPLY